MPDDEHAEAHHCDECRRAHALTLAAELYGENSIPSTLIAAALRIESYLKGETVALPN